MARWGEDMKEAAAGQTQGTAHERFELEIDVRPEDIDELGHVNNVVFLRWVQEAAVAHWSARTSKEERAEVVWVAARHEIDYKRPVGPGERVIAVTWVGPASRHSFERNTEILRANRRELTARARTIW